MSTLHDVVVATASLQDYWPLDGASVPALNTQGTSGTFSGSPVYHADGGVNGLGSVEAVTDSDYFASADTYSVAGTGSMELWFKPPSVITGISTPTGFHLLGAFTGSDDPDGTQWGPSLFTYHSGSTWTVVGMMPVPSLGTPQEATRIATTAMVNNRWNQVVLTWTPTLATVYVNGVAAGTIDPTAWFADDGEFIFSAFNESSFYVFGGYSGGGSSRTVFGMHGEATNVSTYYNHALTSTEVSDHWDAGKGGPAMRVTKVSMEALGSDVMVGVMRVTKVSMEALCPDSSIGSITNEVTATTSIRAGSVGSTHFLPVLTATTSIRAGSVGSGHVLPVVTATTSIRVGSVGSEAYLPVVTATTGIRVGLKAEDPFFMTASTALRIGLKASAPNQKNVTATTDIRIGHRPSTSLISTFVYASASTGIRVGHAQSVSVSRSRLVAAVTAFRIGLSASCRLGVGHIVRAATSLWAGSLGAETRDAAVSATTSLSIAHQATKGREIFVSAITGIFATSDEDDEVAKAAKSTTSLRVGLNASASVGGHDAATGFRIGHMASATRAIPWRPDGLNLQPGGNLPHS